LIDVSKKTKENNQNHVIMDAAAGLGEEAKSAINAADEIIM